MSLNTNTDAPLDTCLQCGKNWDLKSLERIATNQKTIRCGSPSKTTSLRSGDLETEVSGARGYEITKPVLTIEGGNELP